MRRSAVLARRAAIDPNDRYVQLARVLGKREALTALVAEGDGEEARAAQAELDASARVLGGTHAPLFPPPGTCDVVAELRVRVMDLELENAYFKSVLAVPLERGKFGFASSLRPSYLADAAPADDEVMTETTPTPEAMTLPRIKLTFRGQTLGGGM